MVGGKRAREEGPRRGEKNGTDSLIGQQKKKKRTAEKKRGELARTKKERIVPTEKKKRGEPKGKRLVLSNEREGKETFIRRKGNRKKESDPRKKHRGPPYIS